MARSAALLLLLAFAAVGASARPLMGQLACLGVSVPLPVTGLRAVGGNGIIKLSWNASPCADYYAATVDSTDLTTDNVLLFNVTGTAAVVTNVANSRPYAITLKACKAGGICSAPAATTATPTAAAQQAPTPTPTTPAGSSTGPASILGWRIVNRPANATAF